MMRRAVGRTIDDGRDDVTPATQDTGAEGDEHREHCPQPVLETTRRADAKERAHQEPEIEAPDVDEEAF
jgi:hypothetical protein